ncbi:hypothetical protein COCON_G00019560 [Conger conger]|uniref:Uncharacterized protein n=1 Tax=Conger conger TaxID=82655 RepID=A0A9Q1E431_CONCO|nr:hypothetical protein COCON_G00019560 [Conger conger]
MFSPFPGKRRSSSTTDRLAADSALGGRGGSFFSQRGRGQLEEQLRSIRTWSSTAPTNDLPHSMSWWLCSELCDGKAWGCRLRAAAQVPVLRLQFRSSPAPLRSAPPVSGEWAGLS